MYLCSAILKYYEDTGRPEQDLPLVEWSTKYCLYHVQDALDEIMRNFPSVFFGQILRAIVFPTGKSLRYPNDRVGHKVAALLIEPSEARNRLTEGIFKSMDPSDPIGRIQCAFNSVIAAEQAERKLRKAGIAPPELGRPENWLEKGVDQEVITQQEAELISDAYKATRAAIMVDDFAF